MIPQIKWYTSLSYLVFAFIFVFWLWIFGMYAIMGFGFGITAVLQHIGWSNHKVGDSGWKMTVQFGFGFAGIGLLIFSVWAFKKWEIICFRLIILWFRLNIKNLDKIAKSLKCKAQKSNT